MAMLSIHPLIPGKDMPSVVIYLLSIATVAWTVLKYIEARKSPVCIFDFLDPLVTTNCTYLISWRS